MALIFKLNLQKYKLVVNFLNKFVTLIKFLKKYLFLSKFLFTQKGVF